MSFDALTMSAVRDTLQERLLGGRVQRIVRPSRLSLGLEVYAGQRYQLLISAEAQNPVVMLSDEKLRRGTEQPSPLQLLLRKYVRGARLRSVVQPEWERVLTLGFEGGEGRVELVCEIMGRLSNVILVDDNNRIMDAAKRLPPSVNSYRTILPSEAYVPPPPQDKVHPLEIDARRLLALLQAQSGRTLARRLVQAVFGISPLLAREIVYRSVAEARAEGPADEDTCRRMMEVVRQLLALPQTHAWRPCVAYDDVDGSRQPVTYAPYLLTHHADIEEREDVNRAIREVRERQVSKARALIGYEQVRQRLHETIADQLERLEGRLAKLRKSLVPEAELEELQLKGNAVLTMSYQIEPGQDELVIERRQVTGESGERGRQEIVIDLDPGLSPSANAQRIFRRYEKRKAAAEKIPGRIRETELQVDYLEQLDADVDLAENRQELDEVEAALREEGYLRDKGKKGSAGRSKPLRVHTDDGTLILVGRNSRQNHEVTFREASGDDLWLHAHGVPGAHVIVKSGGAPVSSRTLDRAASLAAYYSAARDEGAVQVDYTERRYVRHIRGAAPGLVTYRNEETMVVEPQAPRERR